MDFRKIKYLDIKPNPLSNVESIVHFSPENIVILKKSELNKNDGGGYDFGRFCFITKDSKPTYNPVSGRKEYRVLLSSILPERRDFVRETINYVRSGLGSHETIKDRAQKLVTFFLFLDREITLDEWPTTLDKLYVCYYKYAEYLINRSRIPKGGESSISTNTAYSYAKSIRELIGGVYGISRQEVERKIPLLSSVSRQHAREITPKFERQKFIYVCLSIFEQFHRAILDRKPFPWRIDLSNAGLNCSFLWGGRSSLKSEFDSIFYRTDGSLVKADDLSSVLDSMGAYKSNDIVKINGVGKRSRNDVKFWHKNREARFEKINTNNEIYEGYLCTSWEISVYCFWYCFLAATGLNYSVASNLTLGSEEYRPQRGYTFSGLKVRAGNKLVFAEFHKTFSSYFIKFKELRSWAVSLLDIDPDIWFFLFSDTDPGPGRLGIQRIIGTRTINKQSFRKVPSGSSYALKSIFKKNEIPVQIITAKHLRAGVSFDLYKMSGGDSSLVAQKLGNDTSTVQKSYSNISKENSYPELVEYYNKVMEKIRLEGHSKSFDEPVKILNKEVSGSLPVGNCENSAHSVPKKAPRFSENTPDPDCARSETCLFCEFFAIHIDREGLKKIISFRRLFPLMKEQVGAIDRYLSVFGPIEARIDEILDYIKESNPAKIGLINEIAMEVSEGNLDEFWEHHFDFIHELGYFK